MDIFKILTIQRQLRNGEAKPADVVVNEVLDFLKGYLWLLFIIFAPILALTGVFGLSSFAGGPYGIAKFFFWFFFIVFFFSFLVFYFIYKGLKKMILRSRSTLSRFSQGEEVRDLVQRQ